MASHTRSASLNFLFVSPSSGVPSGLFSFFFLFFPFSCCLLCFPCGAAGKNIHRDHACINWGVQHSRLGIGWFAKELKQGHFSSREGGGKEVFEANYWKTSFCPQYVSPALHHPSGLKVNSWEASRC